MLVYFQSIAEYTTSLLNRFKMPLAAGVVDKNRRCRPSRVVHFFNCPPGFTYDSLVEVSWCAELSLSTSGSTHC